ncbi:MAG: hypothetical protein ABI771_17595 [Betaproteobacteria bacterium]
MRSQNNPGATSRTLPDGGGSAKGKLIGPVVAAERAGVGMDAVTVWKVAAL